MVEPWDRGRTEKINYPIETITLENEDWERDLDVTGR